MTKRRTEEEAVEVDDDPTADLEIISEELFLEGNPAVNGAAAPEPDMFGLAGLGTDIGDAKEAITSLKSELKARAEAINTLQFELEQLRVLSSSLEQEVRVSEEVVRNLGNELHTARSKQTNTEELLKICDSEIASLKLELLANEESCGEYGQEAAVADSGSEAHEAEPEPDLSANDNFEEEQQCARMIVAQGGEMSGSYALGWGELSLGSSPDNDVQIDSQFVSRHHAKIVSNATECVLKDLASTNGTFVNSKRIKRHALRSGDSIVIGKNRFEFVEHQSQPSRYHVDTPDVEART